MNREDQSKNCKKNATCIGQGEGLTPVIGLAGGIGSGKSLVGQELAAMGCAVIDGDRLAKQVRNEPEVLEEIRGALGGEFFDEDGAIDDKCLAEHVFGGTGEASALARLNGIVHPLVINRCREMIEEYRVEKACPAIVLDAALLFETELGSWCDAVIFVAAKAEIRSQRVAQKRGWSEKQWQDREKSQILLDKKANMSDYIVENNSSKTDLRCHIQELFPRILGKIDDVQRKARVSEGVSEASDGMGRPIV